MTIEAEITFRPAIEVGRTTPLRLDHPTARYRPHVTVKTSTPPLLVSPEDRLGVEFPQQCEELQPGRATRLRFQALYPNVDYSALQPGVDFSILEGPVEVGSGRVVRVIAPDTENSEFERPA
jgi:hypothetical protein